MTVTKKPANSDFQDKVPVDDSKKEDLDLAMYTALAITQFSRYMKFIGLKYGDWFCEIKQNGDNYEIHWRAAIRFSGSEDGKIKPVELPVAGKYFFRSNVSPNNFRQMFAIVVGVQMHPKSALFNWILQQEKYYKLGDDVHDNIMEVLLRSSLAALVIAGIKHGEIASAFFETVHFDYNVARVMSLLKGNTNRKRH